MSEEIKIKTFCKCGQQINENESYTQYSLENKKDEIETLCFDCFSKKVDAACKLYDDIISL